MRSRMGTPRLHSQGQVNAIGPHHRRSIRVMDALGHRNVVSLIPITVSDSPSRTRQYAGLAVVIVVYLGGIVGWSWAVTSLNSEPTPPDTVQTPPSSSEASPAP